MGFMFSVIKRLIKTVLKVSLYFIIFAAVIVLIPNLPPYTKFTSIEISPTQPRIGPLATNGILNNAGKMYNGKLLGPEAFQVLNGELYTSLATGEIVKLSPEGHVTFVTTVGQPCSGLVHEHICGRPLGFVIDDKGQYLYVADAYHGIWKVDLKTDKKQLLVSPRVEIEKRRPMLFNSVALAKNGDLYWTDSSSEFHLKDGSIGFLTDPSGRLFHYDAAKNQSKLLLDDLWFANGVVLAPNNEFVVVTESARARIMKYYISGPKKGQSEVFVDGLPGTPDNSRMLPDGSGILVALYTVFEEDRPPLTGLLAAAPLIRKFVARLQLLIEIPFQYLNNIYPHILFEEIVYNIGHFKTISGITPAMAGILQVDWDGNIVAAYYNTDGSLGHISDAIVFKDKLYTGSPHLQTFVGVVPSPPQLKKAFDTVKTPEVPKVVKSSQETKPVQASAKKTEQLDTKKAETSKVENKAKLEEKPKAASKQVQDNKVEEKKEMPKVVKQTTAETKQPQQTKPATAAPAPAAGANVPNTGAKVNQAPTPPPPPKTTGTTAKPAKNEPKTTTTKPEVKSTPPPKMAERTTTSPPRKTTPQDTKSTSEGKKATQAPLKKESPKPAESKPKPIKEEIPSDTAKPTKETLKVIKKDGPAEIPVPN